MRQVITYGRVLNKLTNAGFFEFFALFVKELKVLVLGLAAVAPLWPPFEAAFNHWDAVYKRNKKAKQTKLINATHKERNKEISNFRKDVDYFRRSGEPAKAAAANAVKDDLLDVYGGLEKKTMWDETGDVRNMVGDAKNKASIKANIEALGLMPRITAIEQKNDTFETYYVERQEAIEAQRQAGNSANVRPMVNKAFTTLVNGLEAQYELNEAGAKDPAIRAQLKAITDKVNAQIRQAEHNLARTGHPGGTASGGPGANHPDGPSGPYYPDTSNPPIPPLDPFE